MSRGQVILNQGWGRTIVFVYGVLAFSATGRASFELATKFGEAPFPYGLSLVAALVYLVATFALATNRVRLAWATIGFEAIGVITVGALSLVTPGYFPAASVWSGFGVGYGLVPLLLPPLGLWWLLRGGAAQP